VWYEDRDEALRRLFAVAGVRYAEREGAEGQIGTILALPGNAPFRARFRPIEVPARVATVASSEVRRRIRSGRSVTDLVPPEVLPLVRA
jgi:nicotinic acid mononucleotide adenylyltransferase